MRAKRAFRKQLKLWHWFLILFMISVVISVFYNRLSIRNEHRNRLVFAENLLEGDNARALQIFEEWYQNIRFDSLILCEKIDEDTKIERLKKAFDSTFFEKYTVSFFFCDADEDILLKDGRTVNCHDFFEDKIRQQGSPTANKNLFKFDPDPFDFGYLGIVRISNNQELYIEFMSKEKLSWLQNTLRDNRYSVAYYDPSGLVRRIGLFEYPLKLSAKKNQQNKAFSEYERYSHLLVYLDDPRENRMLIISKRIPRIQNRLATFSFVFILNLCLGLLVLLVWKRASRQLFRTFAQRLHLTVLAIVLSTFIVTGISSVFYVQRLNSQKNQKVLREKTHSLLLLMEQAFGEYAPIEILNNPLLQSKLTDFSDIFFTDVFFYDETGYVVAKSSVEEVFQNSAKNEMDLQAFRQLNREHKNFYVQKETLGEYSYYSSYVPFRNFRNELVGYLNLPFLARQTELRQEISAFIMAYINLFVVLIMVAFLLVFLIIKRLTKPLVESERQIAWNEMAKQIAHEIKNPLTPMKLSVQQIQKAWNDKKDDFDTRMKYFSTVMIEQIDTLSTIASEFSSFAQQPNVKLSEVNIKNCLKKAVLLMNTDNIIQFEATKDTENAVVFVDEKQLSRALVNILKNAKHAVSELENPKINVSLSTSGNSVIISIQDNGKGVPLDIQNRIFEPNFTTKTSGAGLGLAITKNIIERFNGSISFETNKTNTTFFVVLPKIQS